MHWMTGRHCVERALTTNTLGFDSRSLFALPFISSYQAQGPFYCSVCHKAVNGEHLSCRLCGHGGHSTHIEVRSFPTHTAHRPSTTRTTPCSAPGMVNAHTPLYVPSIWLQLYCHFTYIYTGIVQKNTSNAFEVQPFWTRTHQNIPNAVPPTPSQRSLSHQNDMTAYSSHEQKRAFVMLHFCT